MLASRCMVVCALDPYAGLLLVPAAHLSLVVALPQRPRRSLLTPAIVAAGLAFPPWHSSTTARVWIWACRRTAMR